MLRFKALSEKKKSKVLINPKKDDVTEAKVDKGRSDYGKASIRNYRRKGPGHGEPGMFDSEGKRGKTIELRRKEHKDRRGVKGAKVPAYKREDVEVAEAKVDMKTPDYKRATVRDKRYGNPHGSHELGGGIRKDRRADHEAKRGVKTKGMKEETLEEKMSSYDRNRKAAAKRAAARNAARAAGKTGVVPGVGYVTPHRERETYRDEAGVERHKSGAKMPSKKKVSEASCSTPKAKGKKKVELNKETLEVVESPNPYGKRAKLKMLIKGFAEKERSKAGVTKEGSSYGITKGSGIQSGPMAAFAKKDKKKKKDAVPSVGTPPPVSEAKTAAWQRKEGKNKEGGLNEKGRKSYERENPGSDLKAPQPEGGPRKKSFCARMGGVKGPMKDEKGRPTRKALALRKWKCSESETLQRFSTLKLIDSVHTQENAYASQEEVSEKTTEKETILDKFSEATRYKKETGNYVKGGTKAPSTPKKKDAALDAVKASITAKYGKGAIMRSGSNQQKKVKGAKPVAGTGKYKKAADQKKQTTADAKKRGFKSTQNYVDTMARYGGKKNYDKGRGLGT